jgi:hypothetical protein
MIIRKVIGKNACSAIMLLCILISAECEARGVSPYLPLNLAPDIERKIERVLILADKPVMRRPIAAAVVLDALPKACQQDADLCNEVRQYLERFMHKAGVSAARVEGAVTSGHSSRPDPNHHGMPLDSRWDVNASAYYQPSDYLLINGGVVGYQGRWAPTGSVVSMGTEYLQLDVGFRDHWLSPNSDSSMLMSTEAPTMPSVTISNYQPISSLGINYELFLARMSTQHGIRYKDTTTDGHPNLAGIQLGIEPADGYAISVNRLMQYGGGARGSSTLRQFYKALFDNNSVNRGDTNSDLEFGNQEASVTASAIFPGPIPFAVHAEYAAEDGAYSGLKYFGDTAMTLGIQFPKLWRNFDFNFEASEWQNAWYVHSIYPQGMSNSGYKISHWFGDERMAGSDIGGSSQSANLGYQLTGQAHVDLSYRLLKFDPRWRGSGANDLLYGTYREYGLRYSDVWRGHDFAIDLNAGKDALGKSFFRLSGSVDFAGYEHQASIQSAESQDATTSIFYNVGINRNRVKHIVAADTPDFTTSSKLSYHAAIGARRLLTDRTQLGVRLDVDQADNHSVIGLRMLDARYNFQNHFSFGGFFGVGRYSVGLPAYGWYYGIGMERTKIFRSWDLTLDLYSYLKMGRDKALPDDPPIFTNKPRIFFNVDGLRVSIGKSF